MKYEMTMKRWTITVDTEANTISGDTYNMRAEIKDNFDVTWNKAAKVWRGENLEAQIEKLRAYLTRVYYLTALEEPAEIAEVEKTEKAAPAKRNARVIDRFVDTKPCPYCHTYCYGDCSFNR